MGHGDKNSFRQRMLELCTEHDRLQERCSEYASNLETLKAQLMSVSADAARAESLSADNVELKAKLAALSEQASRCNDLMTENRELKGRIFAMEAASKDQQLQQAQVAADPMEIGKEEDKEEDSKGVGLPSLAELALVTNMKDGSDKSSSGEPSPAQEAEEAATSKLPMDGGWLEAAAAQPQQQEKSISPGRKPAVDDSDSSDCAARRRSSSKAAAAPINDSPSLKGEAEDRGSKPKQKKKRKKRSSDADDQDSEDAKSRSPSSGSKSNADDSDDDDSCSSSSVSSSGSDDKDDQSRSSSRRHRKKKKDGKDGKDKKDKERRRSKDRDRSRRDRRHRDKHRRRRRKTRHGRKKDRSRSRSASRSRSRPTKPGRLLSPRRTFGSGDHRQDLDGFISKNQLEARVAHALRTMSEADQRRVMGTDGGENSYLLIDRVKNPNAVVMSRIRKLEGR